MLGLVLNRNHSIQESPQSIFFLKLMGLGSLITSLDAVEGMKRKYPGTRFILITETNVAEGIKPFKVFDEVWAIPTNNVLKTFYTAGKTIIKSWRFKNRWVVDLEVYSKLTTVYSLLTIAVNRFGFYLYPVFFRRFLNTHNVYFDQATFLEDNYLEMARAVTGEPILFETPDNSRWTPANKDLLLLNNTCSDLAFVRKMPDETFYKICKWVLQHTAFRIAFLGAPGDQKDIDQFMERYSDLSRNDRVTNFAGQLDWPTYYKVFSSEAICLVTIDSGPLHIARKLGLPTLSIWGPTSPGNFLKTNPLSRKHQVYHYSAVKCSPCIHLHETLPCKGNNFCMKDIPVEAITSKLNGLLYQLRVPEASQVF